MTASAAWPSLFPVADDPDDTFRFERALYASGCTSVAGIDEAGRGPLAGPVVAACVILSLAGDHSMFKDSKLLTARRRNQLFSQLQASDARIGVGSAGPREIERLNLLQASLLAMKRAMDDCAACCEGQALDHLLVDGTFRVPVPVAQTTLVKGERNSASIAAASIIAKVTRDRLMAAFHDQYPHYGFLSNQGYPTRTHRRALRDFGPCPVHRRTFRGVREFCTDGPAASTITQALLWTDPVV
jgi:ribonuclease HII